MLKGLHAAWNMRLEKNAKTRSSRPRRRKSP
jgi:hypothetical protein